MPRCFLYVCYGVKSKNPLVYQVPVSWMGERKWECHCGKLETGILRIAVDPPTVVYIPFLDDTDAEPWSRPLSWVETPTYSAHDTHAIGYAEFQLGDSDLIPLISPLPAAGSSARFLRLNDELVFILYRPEYNHIHYSTY